MDQNNFALMYPTLVVGLGGTGARATRQLKRLVERYFRSRGCDVPPIIRYLVIDTEDLRNLPGEEPLAPDEYINLGSDFDANRVVEYMEQTEGLYESIREWWTSTGHDAGRIRVKNGAGQMRDVGRLALFVGYQHLVDRLKATVAQIQSVANLQKSQQILSTVGMRPDSAPQVWLTGSLCGGTGAGIFLDVAYLLRDLLQTRSTFLPNGIFVLPQAFMPALAGKVDLQRRIQANAYASLLELSELMNNADRGKFEFYPDQQNRVALESAFAQRAELPVHAESLAGRNVPDAYARGAVPTTGGSSAGRDATGDERRSRLRPPSVPFDRVFLVDQENEGSVTWSSMESVTDMVAQSLLVNIVYRQQIEWEERNIYFTETYPGIPNGWRHFNSLGASSMVLLHGEEQDQYTLALQRHLCQVLIEGARRRLPDGTYDEAILGSRVDEVVETIGPARLLAELTPSDLGARMGGRRPTIPGRVEWERAARFHEYLRSELRVVRQDEIERLSESLPAVGVAIRDRLERVIEDRAWDICRSQGLAAARKWVGALATEIDKSAAELRQSSAEDGAHGRHAAREQKLSDDALGQIESRGNALRRIDGIRGSIFEYPIRAALWVWARVRGRGTDLDRLYDEADRRMRAEFDARARQVLAREATQIAFALLGSRGQQRDRAVISRLEALMTTRQFDILTLSSQLDDELTGIKRRLAARRGDSVVEGRVVSDIVDAPDEISRERVVDDLREVLRTEFMGDFQVRLVEAFGPTLAWQGTDLREQLRAQAVAVYVRWLSQTTEQYAADGIKADASQLKMKIRQSRALVNYTREVRADDLCPHLRRVFVADSRTFLNRFSDAMAEEGFASADCYGTRNPLRVDVYQAVYGLPASLLTHVDEYGRVYEELFTKAERGQACPLHLHRSWNERVSRPNAGVLA